MARIGLVTCTTYPEITADDRLLADVLEERGHEVSAVPWNGDRTVAEASDLLVLRSAWDVWNSESNQRSFLGWLDWAEHDGPPLWNTPAVVRWCLDKRYITRMTSSSVRIPTTIELKPGRVVETMERHGWPTAILKPALGGSGDGVELIDIARAAELDRDGIEPAWNAWMLQEFVPDIQTHGETSVVVIDGGISHAITKVPPPGEYRSNSRYTAERRVLEADEIPRNEVEELLSHVPSPPLYARVDIVMGSDLSLIEIEVVDPAIFLAVDDNAALRFATAIEQRLP